MEYKKRGSAPSSKIDGNYIYDEVVLELLGIPRNIRTFRKWIAELQLLYGHPILAIPRHFHVSQIEEIDELLRKLKSHKMAARRARAKGSSSI
jgi:hypothetical protein